MFRFVLFNTLIRQKVDIVSRFLVSRNSKLARYTAEQLRDLANDSPENNALLNRVIR